MQVGGRILAMLIVATGLIVPATASAVPTAKVTDDGGNPVVLTAGAPLALRNMDVKAFGNIAPGDGLGYTVAVTGPDGLPATSGPYCSYPGIEHTSFVDYRGNGQYTLTLSTYTDGSCTKGKKDFVFAWTVNASVSIAPPAQTLLIRQPNSFSTITQQFNFAGNPGASGYEIKYAKGAVVNPDGSLNSPALKDAYLNSTTGKVELIGAREPGPYTIVARARVGQYYSPWSAPATFNLIAPFDLSSRSFPDSRGPSYQVRAIVGEPTAAGSRVTVAAAKGKNGRHFRTLGKAKVNSQGVFKLRFHLARGTYRMRYSFRGNATVARGTVYEVVRVKRILG